MNRIKVLAVGATGLVGSGFLEKYRDFFEITTAGRTGCDLSLDLMFEDQIKQVIQKFEGQFVVNFAAFTQVDKAEAEFGDKAGEVYRLNVKAPEIMAFECKRTGKKLIHLSTDYVFDGLKESSPYSESEPARPVKAWYSQTKKIGEDKVISIDGDWAVVRISYPFSPVYKNKLDIARAVVETIKKGKVFSAISDQKIKPASVLQISRGIKKIIESNGKGIFHIAGNYNQGFITPFDFAVAIARVCGLDLSLIKPVSFDEFSKTRTAKRPRHTWMSTQKIEDLGMEFESFNEVLLDFKKRLI